MKYRGAFSVGRRADISWVLMKYRPGAPLRLSPLLPPPRYCIGTNEISASAELARLRVGAYLRLASSAQGRQGRRYFICGREISTLISPHGTVRSHVYSESKVFPVIPRSSGGLWRPLVASGGFRLLLAACGGLCRALAACGGLWRRLAAPGGFWWLPVASGGLWRSLLPCAGFSSM